MSSEMENATTILSTDSLIKGQDAVESLENYDMSIKVIFAAVGVLFMFFSSVALIALNRTRQTPSTARFLSSGLICYDIIAVFCYTIRKFVDDHNINIIIQVTGTGFCVLAYITVGIMSLERLVIFYSPHFYLRRITPKVVRKSAYTIWIIVSLAYYFVRYIACYVVDQDFTLYDVVGKCNRVSFLFYGAIIVAVVITSIACYVEIFMIVQKEKPYSNGQQTLSATARHLQNYKSTSLVFVYLVIIVVTSLGYAVLMVQQLSTVPLRLGVDFINTFNCMMDPCMYILWYSECRLEMLKMMTIFNPSLSAYVEKMRFKVFDIVTTDTHARALRPAYSTQTLDAEEFM